MPPSRSQITLALTTIIHEVNKAIASGDEPETTVSPNINVTLVPVHDFIDWDSYDFRELSRRAQISDDLTPYATSIATEREFSEETRVLSR